MAAKIAEAVHNQLSDGLLPYRDQRFGQNFGVGVQPGAQTACHHNDGDVGAFAVVHILAPGKDDVGDDAALVEDGQCVDAMLLQHFAGFTALRHRQAEGMVVGGVIHCLVRRAAAQEEFADVAIGDNGFQLAFRRDEQDALAGLVQLAQGLQYRGSRLDKQFFYFDQGSAPFRAVIFTVPARPGRRARSPPCSGWWSRAG